MFDGFFERILGLSGRYNFYKSEYARLEDKCKTLESDNASLRDDVMVLLERLNANQEVLLESRGGTVSSDDVDKILDALMSNQYYFSRSFDECMELLRSLEDACMRAEKSSAYTNVKLDSKFDDNRRFLVDEVLSRLE